jgi:hypothetical protein
VAESTDKFFFFLGQKTFPKYLSWYISARWKLRAGAGKDVLHEAATDSLQVVSYKCELLPFFLKNLKRQRLNKKIV